MYGHIKSSKCENFASSYLKGNRTLFNKGILHSLPDQKFQCLTKQYSLLPSFLLEQEIYSISVLFSAELQLRAL